MSHLVPFGTLFRYFASRYVGWVGLCLVGLAMIISLIQTVELVRRVSVRSVDNDEISYIKLAFLNLPSVIEMTLPIGVLAGSMLCFAAWNRTNEFVVVMPRFGQIGVRLCELIITVQVLSAWPKRGCPPALTLLLG